MPKRTITAEEASFYLEKLACSEPKAQQETLSQLCPCRSECYERDIWTAICRAYDSPKMDKNVLHQALHALETLVEYAERDTKAQELLAWLVMERLLTLPLEKPGGPPTTRNGNPVPAKQRKQKQKITSRDIPRLLKVLEEGDVPAQCSTLRLLCPCRNVRYDKEVWLAIFRAYEKDDSTGLREDATHVIGTLLERARTDPRSQELLRWLAGQGIRSITLESAIPVWHAKSKEDVNGLTIPRYERNHRSRTNRRH